MAPSVGSRYVRTMSDPTSLPNFPPPASEHPLRGRVLDILLDEGFQPDIDSDGDVAFKVQGQQLFVRCLEGDFTIMRVFGQWQIGEDVPQDLLTQLQACNDLTLRLNIVKAGIANNTLVVTGEHVVSADTDVAVLLQVTTQLVLSAVHMWHEQITGGPGAEATGRPRGPGVTDLVRLEVEAGIGTIRIDRPPMNALNIEVQEGLRAAAAEASERRDVSAVIVYGGEKVFAAGADIKEMQAMSYTDMVDRSGALQSAFTAVARIPKPTVAAVTGYALGGGCELALACDFRVVGDNARLGQPEILLGLIPGAGGTQRLARLVGPARAKELIFSGRFVAADEALRIGLVDEVVDAADVLAAARRRVARVRRWTGVRAACREGGHRPGAGGRPRHRPGDRADAVRRPVRDPRP